jgi:hypothetical protein
LDMPFHHLCSACPYLLFSSVGLFIGVYMLYHQYIMWSNEGYMAIYVLSKREVRSSKRGWFSHTDILTSNNRLWLSQGQVMTHCNWSCGSQWHIVIEACGIMTDCNSSCGN